MVQNVIVLSLITGLLWHEHNRGAASQSKNQSISLPLHFPEIQSLPQTQTQALHNKMLAIETFGSFQFTTSTKSYI